MTAPEESFLTPDPIDVQSLEQAVRGEERGAVVTYQGVVRRDKTEGGDIDHLLYEAYQPMAEKELERLSTEARGRWPELQVLVRHRVGRVAVGDTSVFIAVSALDRAAAFEACRFLIDGLKSRAPIWKKDVYAGGGSAWTVHSHETMLLSDEAIAIPES